MKKLIISSVLAVMAAVGLSVAILGCAPSTGGGKDKMGEKMGTGDKMNDKMGTGDKMNDKMDGAKKDKMEANK